MSEGQFMPGDHRKKLVHNVIKTHFTLGNAPAMHQSSHQQHFQSPESQNAQKSLTSISTKGNLKLSDETSRSFQTEFKSQFSRKEIVSNKSPFGEDRYKHQHKLGGNGPSFTTTNSHFHGCKNPDKDSSISPISLSLRKHNFELGTNSVSFESSMRNDYKYRPGSRIKTKPNLQHSKVRMGGDPPQYKTHTQLQFIPKSYEVPTGRSENPSHIVFGTDKQAFTATSRTFFTAKKTEKQDLDTENFRKNNIYLGNSPANYSSVASEAFKAKESTFSPSYNVKTLSHFRIGNDASNWQTAYKDTHETKALDQQTRSVPGFKNKSKVVFGTVSATNASKNAETFRGERGTPGALELSCAKHLKTHHFYLGEDKGQFRRKSCEPAGNIEKKKNLKDAVSNMQSSHWKFGNYNQAIAPTSNDYKSYQNTDRTNFDKNMSRSHWNLGPDAKHGHSDYRANFNWIQPVPDRSFKFRVGDN